MPQFVYAIATLDTKGHELEFACSILKRLGISVRMVDIGTLSDPQVSADVTRETVSSGRAISKTDRGEAVTAMGEALRDYLVSENRAGNISGVLGIGGSGGTAMITAAMRALPIGMPKLMVSTVASGNTAPYVDCSDITMMYSVVDVAGLNTVSKKILANAAHAIAGMVQHETPASSHGSTIAMTMFGVTTPCVSAVRESLEKRGFDCLVFHATGVGGRAMEQLVDSGLVDGVLDITTTEVADEVVGGCFPAGPHRFEKLLARKIPLVLSLGALDMVNFGAIDSLPERFRGRLLYKHNPQVTLMRTTIEENREIARWMANKLNRSTSPLRILIPEKGVSMLDAEGQPFYDPVADEALFSELQKQLQVGDGREIIRLPNHINDKAFADSLVENYLELAGQR
jgi:uncharacterized protein (UPF0261 family)